MSVFLVNILSYSILLAGIIALVRFKKISSVYYPFVFILWIGILNETLSIILMRNGFYTIINNNIYVLLEGVFITWFFKRLGLFSKKKYFFAILVLIVITWLVENLLLKNIFQLSLYYRIIYSFSIVLMSVSMINKILIAGNKTIERNPVFLFCSGFILYFTLKALVNSFWLYGLTKSRDFIFWIQVIMTFVNFITNLIYALGILWIPKKQPSLLRSSSRVLSSG